MPGTSYLLTLVPSLCFVRAPLLERGYDHVEKGVRLESVQRPVVDGEGDIAQRPHADRFDAVDLDGAHTPLDFADAKNRDLRLIDDDGRREETAAHSVVRDG